MDPQRIVIIGAGSPTFGANLLADVFVRNDLRGGWLGLVDIDEQGLELTAGFARRANAELDFRLTIAASTDRRDLLPGAEVVIVAIGVETIDLWELEWGIAQKHGIHHAWCGLTGPAGLVRTLRMVPPVLGICRDMEELCPDAWLLNYANPVSRLGFAISQHTAVRSLGLCHALAITTRHLAHVLDVPPERLQATAAGINHFSFVLDLRFRDSGQDAYPALRRKLRCHDPADQPLSRDTFDVFGLYPVPDDREVSDYLGYCHSATFGSWEKYGLRPLDWEAERRRREAYWRRIRAAIRGDVPLLELLKPSGEQAIEIVLAMAGDKTEYFPAVNIANDGHITNLASGGCVEVPAVADASGIRGVGVGALPAAIASLCERQLTIQALSVEAAVMGSRRLALEALAIDPVVHDIDAAAAALDEMLVEEAAHLPTFA